jgi:flagellar protein FlaI
MKTDVSFETMKQSASFVEKLAQRTGKYISYADPILDGSLPDGSRVNATYTKDITSRGPTFTIRKFTKTPWTPPQLIGFKTLSPEMMAYLWMLVEYKMNILLAGGTSSGKTTLLNALSFFIPAEARVVSIEDTRELNLPRENWLPSVVRTAIGSGKTGEIGLFTLLRASFRQNPDYVIVGEVRGKEAYVLFQGMASGHSSISTIHADSVETVIKRLETPPINLPPTLMNVLDCVCIMTHAIVNKQETRKLKEVVEIINVNPDGTAQTNQAFSWNSGNDQFYFSGQSHIFEKISKRFGLNIQEINNEFSRRVQLIYQLYKQNIVKFQEVQNIINEYHKKPEDVLQRFGVRS